MIPIAMAQMNPAMTAFDMKLEIQPIFEGRGLWPATQIP